RRAEKLKLPVFQGVADKGRTIHEFCRRQGVNPARTVFVGNDVNDLPAFAVVGRRLCPRDAAPEIRRACDYILKSRGGAGVVREIARNWRRLLT
ncbi:MAG: hypothetical protein FJ399_02490, partial [Verrucomicrobia bacterium]|nr:hypothetical protein [Verrucomicrobiota bacterium]